MLKNLLQNKQNLKADGIYSCTGIYFFKLAVIIVRILSQMFLSIAGGPILYMLLVHFIF